MAFTEFDGELDDEAGFQPFDGELDAPTAPAAKPEPGLADRYRGQFEQAKKALGFDKPAPAAAPAPTPAPQPFRDKREAIDEAVNEIELGQPAPKVFDQFAKLGVTQDEIVARGTALGGKAFKSDTRTVTVRDGARDGTMRANEPSATESVVNFGRRVGGRANQMATGALAAAGVIPPESAAAALARSQKGIDAAMPGEAMQRGMEALGGAKTFGEAFGAIAENPAATGLIVAESAALFLPVLAAAVAVGLPAMGTAGLVGASSAAMEFGGALTETLAERNIDARDVVAVERALNDPEFMADARKRGAVRGVTIGAFDALSAGLAGKFISPVVKQIRAGKLAPDAAMRQAAVAATKEIGLQAATGAGGEQAAQSMMGEFKPLDTVIEGLAGVATGPLEAASNIRGAGALARAAGREMSVEDALITALETGQTRPAPPVIRVEDMPTTPLTPEQVAAIAPQPQVEPIPTGEVTELPGMPTEPAETIPTGQATELAGPRATTPADLGVSAMPQGSLAAMAEQQLRGRFVQPELPADAPLAAPATDAGRDQPGRSGGALGRMADDGRAGSVLPGEPVPAGRGGADQPAAAGDAPSGLKTEAPRLQNRDRSDAAYIQQMQAIGKNPDPDRLGVDRNMATGAPIVLADAVPAAQLGRVDRVVTAAGRKFPVQYAVVEAADLLPSNSADGTANAGYADGLPGRARVVAGNGRAAGLQLAFTNGNAAGYVQGITADAADHGVSTATLAAMKQPVLVRIMQPADVTANIGDESNVSGVADKSAKEAARDDARRLDLGTLDFNDDGTLTSAALDAFVAAMPPSEQTALRDSDGAPTKQAQDRLMAAVFQTAYDDDALLALYAQAIDPEARVVMAGLAAAAPQMMALKGAGILDIRAVVSDAAQQAINAKRRGIKLADMAAQADLDRDPDVSVVLGMFARNNRSAKKIGEELRAVAQFAYDEANKPAEDMFGPVPRASRADVLERLNDARSPQSLEDARRGIPAESNVQGVAAAAAGPGNDGAVQADRPPQDVQAEDLAEAPTAEPFKTNGRALVYAAQNGIAGKVKSVEVTGGWALVPKERAPSVLTAEADAKALEAANTALAKSGWKTPAGKPWKLKPAKNVPPIFKTVAAIIDAAFGVRVQAVNGAPGNGLQFRRGAFVDTARVTSPETLIGVTGHEVKHWFDANDKATGAKLDQAIEQHLKAGAVQAQMARENAQLVAGETPMTEAGARLELLSDVNGALWLDPDFWGRLYEIDASAFRKVLYQFMRAATKFIKVAQGSTFDLTAYVDNVAAVRDAAAQAMVERAENRRGKAGPQMLVKNARRGRPSPLDQDLFAENAAAAPVAERPSPRDRDSGEGGVAPTQDGGGTAQPAPASAPTPAQADDFNLTAPTRGDVLAQQQARADETQTEAARRRARDEGERRDRERREIADRARQDASAENFVLGQNADEALAGQNSLFEPDAPYETDLFGNPLPAAAARGRGSRRARQAAQAGDVLAQPGVQGPEAPRGRYATRTQLVTTRQQTLGHAGPIRSLADAAHALSYLGKSAVERLDVLVTDAKDRPLAVVGGFKGAIDQAPVYKGTLVGEVMRIPAAANLWMIHNHPSGKSLLSRSDELLLEQMAVAFGGTAIRPRAVIALGRSEWSGVDDAGNPDRRQPMKPAQAGPTVPAQERQIEVDELLGPEINSPTNAKEAVKAQTDYFMGQSGILLLNKQHAPLAFVPWRSEDAMPLKDNGKLDALYRAVSFSNAATAIIATGSSMPIRSAQNLAAGLARIDVNTLDIIDSNGSSASERGEVINPGILMSRANQSGEWRLFPDTMGGKGIPRADMPQVKVKKRPDLLQFLAKFGIEATRETVPASALKPTQAEYSVKKTESAKGIPATSDDQLVLASADDFVLDGHHRWLARLEQGQPVEVLRFNQPADEVMTAVWQFGETRVSGDSEGAFTESTTRADLAPVRRKKIDDAAALAREWIPAAEVEKAVALLMRFDGVPQADVPAADRERLAAIFAPEIKRAEAVNEQFKTDLTALAERIGAEVKLAPVKSIGRTVEKMYEDERLEGKPAQADWVRDLVRGSIVVNSQAELPLALEALGRTMKIVRVKDRFAKPLPTGYSDILVNVELPNGMNAEVQIHAPPMLAAKDLGHMLYEIARAIKPGADQVRLRMAQEELYGSARKVFRGELTKDSNSASVSTTAPSFMTRPDEMSAPVLADTQAPPGSMTTGMPSRSMSVDPGGRAFQSNMGDSNAGPTSPAILPQAAEYARLADPFAENYARLEGRKVSFDVRIEDTGQTATFTVDAAQYMRELDQRRDVARRLADCVAR